MQADKCVYWFSYHVQLFLKLTGSDSSEPMKVNHAWPKKNKKHHIDDTGQPHYNTPRYNTDFNITRSCLGSQMVIFLLF